MAIFPESPTECMELHLRALTNGMARVDTGKVTLHAPSRVGQWGREFAAPFHGTPEFFLQTEGSTRFECPGGNFRTAPGDITIVGKGVPHREFPEDGRRRFLETVVVFRETGFALLLAWKSDEGTIATSPALTVDTPHTEWLTSSLEQIVGSCCEGEDRRSAYLRGLLLAVLGRVWQDAQSHAPRAEYLPPLVVQCRDLIEAGFTESWLSVQALARRLDCSPDHLSRAYQKATGERLITSLHRRRINHAKSLLRDPSLRISEVAWASGFESPSYFDRLFFRYTGISPRDYRIQFTT